MDGGVQIKDKFCLTIDEASEYFNIGEKKLRQIASENLDSGFVIQNGVKMLIKRKRFETFFGRTIGNLTKWCVAAQKKWLTSSVMYEKNASAMIY